MMNTQFIARFLLPSVRGENEIVIETFFLATIEFWSDTEAHTHTHHINYSMETVTLHYGKVRTIEKQANKKQTKW